MDISGSDDAGVTPSTDERIIDRLGRWLYPNLEGRLSWACAYDLRSFHVECVAADASDEVSAYYRGECLREGGRQSGTFGPASAYSLDYLPRWVHRAGPPLVVVHATETETVTITGVARGPRTDLQLTVVAHTPQ
jgi:hypothetical protein